VNVKRPKHNFSIVDLTRVLVTLWSKDDLIFIPREPVGNVVHRETSLERLPPYESLESRESRRENLPRGKDTIRMDRGSIRCYAGRREPQPRVGFRAQLQPAQRLWEVIRPATTALSQPIRALECSPRTATTIVGFD
jgi:hypothetical protein